MRRKRLVNKRLGFIAVMMILCILAAAYIIKTAGNQAEQREMAQSEEADQAEFGAEEAGETSMDEAAAEASTQRSDKVYAYRGSTEDGLYTWDAYDKAVESGAGAIVLPFVVSKDGTLYVADDDYAQELTGYGGYFSGMTDGQIADLDTRAGTKVLRLSEVFDKYGRDVHYIIELRYTSERNLMAFKELIDKYDYTDAVSVLSEYFSGLRSLDNEFPNMPKIFKCSSEEEWGEALGLESVDAIAVNKDMMSDDTCKEAQSKDKKYGAWNLNTEEEIQRAIDMGADFLFTDEAARAAEIAS